MCNHSSAFNNCFSSLSKYKTRPEASNIYFKYQWHDSIIMRPLCILSVSDETQILCLTTKLTFSISMHWPLFDFGELAICVLSWAEVSSLPLSGVAYSKLRQNTAWNTHWMFWFYLSGWFTNDASGCIFKIAVFKHFFPQWLIPFTNIIFSRTPKYKLYYENTDLTGR